MFFRENTKLGTVPVATPTFSILKSSRQTGETLPATKAAAAVQPAQQPVKRSPAIQDILNDLQKYQTMASAGDPPTRQAGAAGCKLCGQRIDSVNRKLELVTRKMMTLQRQLTTTTTEQKTICQKTIDRLLATAKNDGLIV